MLYTYTAKNAKGEEYTAEAEVADRSVLYGRVRQEGGRILTVREKQSLHKSGLFADIFSSVNTEDKILLAKNLGSMLTAGLSVTRALGVMEKQTRKQVLRELLSAISSEVSRGASLSESLGRRPKIFPPLFASMVKAGEESGNLAESLKIVAMQMDKSHQLTKRVRGAMVYPSVVLTLMVVISILLLIYMVPTLTATYEGLNIELPLSTRIIISASQFMLNHTFIFLGVFITALLAAVFAWRSRAGKYLADSFFIRMPLIGDLLKEIQSARTARTLSSLLSAGVPIVQALDVTEAVVGNHLYKRAIAEAKGAIQKGETISSVLSRYESIYPPFISEMAAVGEETGKIAEMLLNVAVYYEDDVDQRTKDLSTIIEPLLMVLIGAAVGVFAISMLAPTYSLVNNI